MAFKIYNSLSRKIETFRPLKKGKVSIYACGPTVYQTAHVGNLRTYIFEDILRRVLEYNGYKVKHVMNITDVGHLTSDEDEGLDKVELASKKSGLSAAKLTKYYADLFKKDLKDLNIQVPTKFAPATQYIKEQINLVKKLEKNGYTYETADGIYFDTKKFKQYGRLAKINRGIARVCHSHGKHNESDFAVWKFSTKGEKRQQEWPSPWGVGFPGWHLECSAISTKELGQPFDIHLGGEDHIMIHHNNEIAQSEAAYKKPLAKYFVHGAFMLFDNEKMSKSKSNYILLSDLQNYGLTPMSFRYLAISGHYRSKLNFSPDALMNAGNSLKKLEGLESFFMFGQSKGKIIKKYKDKFLKALNNDLNTPEAMKVVWELVKSKADSKDKRATLLDFDKVLGLGLDKLKPINISAEVKKLADERQRARNKKNWAESDRLRKAIEYLGYDILDTASGYTLKPKT